ncbi:MAG: hypothetical protein EBZ47_00220 [Chlamydiae bacterium]|nr:hypothetical protein [Chlamydiota bacterium]
MSIPLISNSTISEMANQTSINLRGIEDTIEKTIEENFKDSLQGIGDWLNRQFTIITEKAIGIAQFIYSIVQPYFEAIANFVTTNHEAIKIGFAGFGIGVLSCAIIGNLIQRNREERLP